MEVRSLFGLNSETGYGETGYGRTYQRTDRRTNGWMDGRRDKASYRVACSRLIKLVIGKGKTVSFVSSHLFLKSAYCSLWVANTLFRMICSSRVQSWQFVNVHECMRKLCDSLWVWCKIFLYIMNYDTWHKSQWISAVVKVRERERERERDVMWCDVLLKMCHKHTNRCF